MSQSATPATRNEARRHWKPPKVTAVAELAIGTAIPRLTWSPANGCELVAQCRANTPSTPRPPEWNGNPCYAFGRNSISKSKNNISMREVWKSQFHPSSPTQCKASTLTFNQKHDKVPPTAQKVPSSLLSRFQVGNQMTAFFFANLGDGRSSTASFDIRCAASAWISANQMNHNIPIMMN